MFSYYLIIIVQIASIDWMDFVVVESIDFKEDEKARNMGFPPNQLIPPQHQQVQQVPIYRPGPEPDENKIHNLANEKVSKAISEANDVEMEEVEENQKNLDMEKDEDVRFYYYFNR